MYRGSDIRYLDLRMRRSGSPEEQTSRGKMHPMNFKESETYEHDCRNYILMAYGIRSYRNEGTESSLRSLTDVMRCHFEDGTRFGTRETRSEPLQVHFCSTTISHYRTSSTHAPNLKVCKMLHSLTVNEVKKNHYFIWRLLALLAV